MACDKLTLIIPEHDNMARVKKMLAIELGNACNIKSRCARLGILAVLTKTMNKLKEFPVLPENGLIVRSTETKCEVTIPDRPVLNSIYYLDSKFHDEIDPYEPRKYADMSLDEEPKQIFRPYPRKITSTTYDEKPPYYYIPNYKIINGIIDEYYDFKEDTGKYFPKELNAYSDFCKKLLEQRRMDEDRQHELDEEVYSLWMKMSNYQRYKLVLNSIEHYPYDYSKFKDFIQEKQKREQIESPDYQLFWKH